jgi:hypothetical protein
LEGGLDVGVPEPDVEPIDGPPPEQGFDADAGDTTPDSDAGDVVFGEDGLTEAACAPSFADAAFGVNPSPGPVCTPSVIDSIVGACFSPDAGTSSCNAFIELNAAAKSCYLQCIFTDWTYSSSATSYASTPWGAFVYVPDSLDPSFVDVGQCLLAAAPGDPAVVSCATAMEEALECEIEACAPSCPIPMSCQMDPTSCPELTSFYTCVSDAASGVCATYESSMKSECATIDAGGNVVNDCLVAAQTIQTATGTTPAYESAVREFLDIACTGSLPGGG